jgi:hypothetical protein
MFWYELQIKREIKEKSIYSKMYGSSARGLQKSIIVSVPTNLRYRVK